MRERAALAALAVVLALAPVRAAEPPVPSPRGFVTDTAGVLGADATARIERIATELRQKTGAEIAVLTVETTAPLDDFTYALRVAETWRPGRRDEDTGILVLVVTGDRKLRILVGYGLEGILPDGLVGEIQDREMVPAFRAGRVADGVVAGVTELARRVATDRGAALDGSVVPPRPRRGPQIPTWLILLLVLLLIAVLLYESRREHGVQRAGPRGRGPRHHYGPAPGGFGDWGGWGGGGGGFDGFGGGGFGGGGAGRSW